LVAFKRRLDETVPHADDERSSNVPRWCSLTDAARGRGEEVICSVVFEVIVDCNSEIPRSNDSIITLAHRFLIALVLAAEVKR
jgi:hypothetical protein